MRAFAAQESWSSDWAESIGWNDLRRNRRRSTTAGSWREIFISNESWPLGLFSKKRCRVLLLGIFDLNAALVLVESASVAMSQRGSLLRRNGLQFAEFSNV